MLVQSKVRSSKDVLGYFDSIPFTCYEVGHTWEPKCYMSFLQTFRDSMKFSLKVYTSFYVVSYLIKMKKKENRNMKKIKTIFRDILQSSIFLSANGTLFMGEFCLLRFIAGKFYGWHGLAVGTLVGWMSIQVERKSRRAMLALYLMNLACETLYRMAVSRNLFNPIKYGEVVIFSVASAGFMSLFRSPGGLPEDLYNPMTLAVGSYERSCVKRTRTLDDAVKLPGYFRILQKLRDFHAAHHACPHPHSCVYYTVEGGLKQFMIGYLIDVIINILSCLRGKQRWSKIFRNFSLASFLGGFAAIFRGSNCMLRWICDNNHPPLHGAISGALAGCSFYFYRSSTMSLYFLFKLLEVLCGKAVDREYLPRIANIEHYIYAVSLGIVAHAACLEPHNIRPGYWKFLCGVSGERFPLMFRKLFDIYGTHATHLYPHFIPDLKPEFVKTPEVGELLLKLGK